MNPTATHEEAVTSNSTAEPAREFLLSGDERHRIEFDGGAWVEITPHVTVGQRQTWSKLATKTKQRIRFTRKGKKAHQEGETEIDFDNEVFVNAMLGDIVKAWSSPSLLTAENIKRMPEWMADRIQEVFNELNPQGGEEDDEEGD
jgi:hypothetical protein